jgi:hypothetical protein
MNLKDRLTPVDVRMLMLGEHRNIRAKLDELSRSAKTLLNAGPRELARVLRLTRNLARDLKTQIALEANVLVPALRNSDAWGKVRADKLIAQLRRRRSELRSLRQTAREQDQTTLGGHIDEYIDERRSGMKRVERESLSPGVLRDDVTGIDVSGG